MNPGQVGCIRSEFISSGSVRGGHTLSIRPHPLLHTGFPVLGDPLYNHPAWGPSRGHRGKGTENVEEVRSSIFSATPISFHGSCQVVTEIVRTSYSLVTKGTASSEKQSSSVSEQRSTKDEQPCSQQGEHNHPPSPGLRQEDCRTMESTCTMDEGSRDQSCTNNRDPDCTECALFRPDPAPHQLLMYLHALSYSGPDWQYSAPSPQWAEEGWREP